MESKHLAVLLALLGLASVMFMNHKTEALTEFESWKVHHGVKYDSVFEEAYRERVFLENLAKINTHNSNKHRTYDMGINQFTGMTQEEFEQNYLGLVVENEVIEESNEDFVMGGDIDWNSQGAVTPVKNQGSCGSCWAFSTTGGLEGLAKIECGGLQNFSESQLVDCSSSYGNMACNGGLMTNAFKYVKEHGIVTEKEYPYKPSKNACSIDKGPFKISGFTEFKQCNQLGDAISKRPVSVAVDATNWSPYKNGVFSNCSTRLNHGVTLVGIKDGAWVIKNSWGPGWGVNGFIYVASGNTCGICNMASWPNK